MGGKLISECSCMTLFLAILPGCGEQEESFYQLQRIILPLKLICVIRPQCFVSSSFATHYCSRQSKSGHCPSDKAKVKGVLVKLDQESKRNIEFYMMSKKPAISGQKGGK